MKNKNANINDILKRISKLEARLDDIAPIAKRKLPSKKDQIEQIKSEIDVFHFDFYRTSSKDEIFDLGYEEYIYSPSYCFIEWSERLVDLLHSNYIKIEMFLVDNKRTITVKKITL